MFIRLERRKPFDASTKLIFRDSGRHALVVAEEDEIRLNSPHRSQKVCGIAEDDSCGWQGFLHDGHACFLIMRWREVLDAFHVAVARNHDKYVSAFCRCIEHKLMAGMKVIERTEEKDLHEEIEAVRAIKAIDETKILKLPHFPIF